MALYALTCTDKPDGRDLRAATREAHLAYLAQAGGLVKAAGALLGEDGGPVGSLLLIEAADMDAARAFADADPYASAGLFAEVDIKPWRLAVGKLG